MEMLRLGANRLRPLHEFLAGRSFYPLALSSGLALGLLMVRLERTHSWGFFFLGWNLILAWIPYLASLLAGAIFLHRPAGWWRTLAPSAVWLAFFPNAPYLVTDLMHLSSRQGDPWLFWFDIVLLATFAWTGCVLGVASLRGMQALVTAIAGWAASWLFVLGATGLGGVGIYLGRFHRWNSWDLLANPGGILADVAAGLSNPATQLRPWGLCALFAAFILVCYLTLTGWGVGQAGSRAEGATLNGRLSR